MNLNILGDVVQVDGRECFMMTRELVRREGIFCGGSCGAAVMGAIKYARELEKEGAEVARDRLGNLEELVNAAAEHLEREPEGDATSFLNELALSSETDALGQEGRVQLMTLHAAKGLEFNCVFLCGLEEELFPHANSLDDPDRLEEERRLAYVGMTRARKRLYCSFASMRRRMGVMEGSMPSRFLMELPTDVLEGPVESLTGAAVGRSQATVGFDDTDLFSDSVQYATVDKEFEDYSQEEHYMYAVGMRIVHNEFGKGVVRKVEGQGDNTGSEMADLWLPRVAAGLTHTW